VARSEAKVASSTSSARPAKADNAVWIRAQRPPGPESATSEVVRMAPALIIGLAGRPVPGSMLTALNGSPLGSAETRARTASRPLSARARACTNGLDTDWMVNGSVSPTR
jgi:hypothetical protein